MGGGPGSALLLGYFSIGEAETYRDYFSTIPQAALGPVNPQWAGNYQVAYWTPEWRTVATTYIDRMITLGYDGVVFDVVDEYQLAWAQANAPGGAAGAEQAMADLVAYLADYAHAKNPAFKIWGNNAEDLLANSTYFSHLDGMIKENLYYTDTGSLQSSANTQWSLSLMQRMVAAGKDVITIEYVSTATKVADVEAKAAHDGLGYYTTNLNLLGVSYTGVLPGQVINPDWSGATTTTPPAPTPVPTAPTNLADSAIIKGYVNAANDTAAQALTGTAQAGTSVSFYDGTTKLGTTTAGSTGSWSYTLGVLTTGAHSLTATATDASGHTSVASSPLAFTVDKTAPVAPTGLADSAIVNGAVSAANDTAAQALTGTAEIGSTVRVYDGTALLGTATAGQNGAWSYTLGVLPSGSHSLSATATDVAGNTGAVSGALAFTVASGVASTTDLVLTGTSYADTLIGQGGNDKLYGNGGNDALVGNAGNDWLEGGSGHDTLNGGAGADSFVFRTTDSKNSDIILDFQPNIDHIVLDNSMFTKVGADGALAIGAYWDGTKAHDASDRVIYNAATGVISYDSDGSGWHSPVTVATVPIGTHLTSADFLVI